jgi:hypothetical protein
VIDGADTQIVLELLECLLDLGQLDVVGPKLGRILVAEIGAQQVATLAAAYLAQLLAVERKGEGLGRDRFVAIGQVDLHQGEGPPGLLLGRADLDEQLIAGRRLGLQLVQAFAQSA